MNIFQRLKKDVQVILQKHFPDSNLQHITIEVPKETTHGDLSINAAMIIAAQTKQKPQDIALVIKGELNNIDYIENVSIAGPGFINLVIKKEVYFDALTSIIKNEDNYLRINIGNNTKVNIEYVSANPTGPMHIGHARGAVYGDVLANLLTACGYLVTKEYYVNDFGGQIDTLAESVYLRYKEQITKEQAIIPKGLYPGDYLIETGKRLFELYQDQLLNQSKEQYLPIIKEFAINEMMSLIKEDLKDLGISHDLFFYESTLHKSGDIDSLVTKLQNEGLIYRGILPEPKGKHKEDWQSFEQLIFRTTNFKDDQDRPLQKPDGAWSYYAADLAYAANKITRGFDQYIMVLGADHVGYVARMKAIFAALGRPGNLDIKIGGLVNYVEKGVPVKMSKRGGSFSFVKDVIDEVGSDIVRFMMITKKNDVIIDFDFAKVKELSKDNPVFYVQYAYVRINSLMEKCRQEMPEVFNGISYNKSDFKDLTLDAEIELIKKITLWPKILESSAMCGEPHRIAYFLYELASQFHSLWSYSLDVNYRFVVKDNQALSISRMLMAKAVMRIIESGFGIIVIKPMEKM